MTASNPYASAFRRYRDELGAAMQFVSAGLTDQAAATLKRDRVQAARQALLAARPAPLQDVPSRDAVLTGLRPSTADTIAVSQHEATKVQAMLDSGRALGDIIASADVPRALAIADLIETMPHVLQSNAGADIIAEVHSLVFDRLADLGVDAAVSVRDAEQRNAPALAWHRAMTEAAEGSDASIGAWQDVHRSDQSGYEAARGGLDGAVDHWIGRIDAGTE